MITVREIIKLSSIFEVHRSRFSGGTTEVSLFSFWALIDNGLPGIVRRSLLRGSTTEPLRVSRSTSVECTDSYFFQEFSSLWKGRPRLAGALARLRAFLEWVVMTRIAIVKR